MGNYKVGNGGSWKLFNCACGVSVNKETDEVKIKCPGCGKVVRSEDE